MQLVWLAVVVLLWSRAVHGYGSNPYAVSNRQAIRIGKLTENWPDIPLEHSRILIALSLNQRRAGLITDDTTDRIRQTFEHAIAVVNSDLSVPLVGETEQVAYGNSVHAFEQLCKLMQVRNA